ncbi:DUF4352 domain-containing protein [Paenibacillus kandeliae]|uniref:DUF4352 domain-containing protein n=1 Tax=Paenibacillus kandeliae TaxID=3231269 RepID=UPI003458922F
MKKTVATLLAFVIFGALAAGSMDSDKSSSDNTSSSKSGTSSASSTEKQQTEQKDKQFYIGDTVGVGNFAVLVHTPEIKSSVGNQYLKQEANGEYWIIPVSVRNDDNEARMITMAMFKLVSKDGTSYDPDSTAIMYMDSKNKLLLDKINPGIQADGYIVFDMPKGQKASNYAIEVNDTFSFTGNSQATIQLSKKK